MGGGGGDFVEDLTARGLFAHKVIPSSFPELTITSRAQQAATGDTVTRV